LGHKPTLPLKAGTVSFKRLLGGAINRQWQLAILVARV
jgi:hypothetical protein